MKKTIIAAVLALGFSQVAFAGATVCPVYEYAELQSMSDKELSDVSFETSHKMLFNAPQASDAEVNNCIAQVERLGRITKARNAGKPKPVWTEAQIADIAERKARLRQLEQ